MDDELRDALAQLQANQIQRNLAENEDRARILNILGKPILEAKSAEKPTEAEINSLKSSEQVSSKGTYLLIQKSENQNNPAFNKLHSYLTEKGGFSNIHGFKAWIFSNDPEKIGMRSVIGW